MIDFHTHVFPRLFRKEREALFDGEPGFEGIYNNPKSVLAGVHDLINTMDEEGVERSVIFGFPWEREDLYRRHNDYIVESVQKHPDRLIGFGCFSILSPGGAKEAERCLKSGLKGVGELAVYRGGLTPDVIRAASEVMSVCSRYDVPMLLHVNEPVGRHYPGKAPMTLHQIYQFLKTYPNNRIVLAHWGGGIFFFSLMRKEVKEVLANTWLDTAASPYLYDPSIYRIAGEIAGYERILFGSDFPLLKPRRYLKEMDAAGLEPRWKEQITGLNATRLLGLKE